MNLTKSHYNQTEQSKHGPLAREPLKKGMDATRWRQEGEGGFQSLSYKALSES